MLFGGIRTPATAATRSEHIFSRQRLRPLLRLQGRSHHDHPQLVPRQHAASETPSPAPPVLQSRRATSRSRESLRATTSATDHRTRRQRRLGRRRHRQQSIDERLRRVRPHRRPDRLRQHDQRRRGPGIALGGDGLHDAERAAQHGHRQDAARSAAGIRLTQWGTRQTTTSRSPQNTLTGITARTPRATGSGSARGRARAGHDQRQPDRRQQRRRAAQRGPRRGRRRAPELVGLQRGPGASGCDAAASRRRTATPGVAPWLLLSLTAAPAQIAAGGGSSAARRRRQPSDRRRGRRPVLPVRPGDVRRDPAGTHDPAERAAGRRAERDLGVHGRRAGADRAAHHRRPSDRPDPAHDPPAPDVVPDVTPDDHDRPTRRDAGPVVELANEGNRTARRLRVPAPVAQAAPSGAACRKIARLRPGQTSPTACSRARRPTPAAAASLPAHVRVPARPPGCARSGGLAGLRQPPCPTINAARERPGPTTRRRSPGPAASPTGPARGALPPATGSALHDSSQSRRARTSRGGVAVTARKGPRSCIASPTRRGSCSPA